MDPLRLLFAHSFTARHTRRHAVDAPHLSLFLVLKTVIAPRPEPPDGRFHPVLSPGNDSTNRFYRPFFGFRCSQHYVADNLFRIAGAQAAKISRGRLRSAFTHIIQKHIELAEVDHGLLLGGRGVCAGRGIHSTHSKSLTARDTTRGAITIFTSPLGIYRWKVGSEACQCIIQQKMNFYNMPSAILRDDIDICISHNKGH